MPPSVPRILRNSIPSYSERPMAGTRNPAIQGVYLIANTITGECYVGSTTDLSKRWAHHKNTLNKGTAPSTRLQQAWNYFGADAFICYITESVPAKCDLVCREQFHIDTVNPEYNHRRNAYRPEQKGYSDAVIALRFWSRVEKHDGECWIWLGPIKAGKCPTFYYQNNRMGVARYAYESEIGPIPEGAKLVRDCECESCVNPHHYKVLLKDLQECKRGHAYTPENTRYQTHGRYRTKYCCTCAREKNQRLRKNKGSG